MLRGRDVSDSGTKNKEHISHTEENTKDAGAMGVFIASPIPSPPGGPTAFSSTPQVEISWSIPAPNLGVLYNKTSMKSHPSGPTDPF